MGLEVSEGRAAQAAWRAHSFGIEPRTSLKPSARTTPWGRNAERGEAWG